MVRVVQRPDIVFASQVRGCRRVRVGRTETGERLYFVTSSRVLAVGVAAEVRSR